MSYPLKFLQGTGLVSVLLIIGVVGGLIAPLPAEAASVTLDGATINVSPTKNSGCTVRSGYTACYDLAFTSPLTVNGKWIVVDCAVAPNCGDTDPKFAGQAKVDVNDVSECGTSSCTADTLSFGGIGIKPVTPSSTGVTGTLVIQHTLNDPNGSNLTGDFYSTLIENGFFDPPSTENAIKDTISLTTEVHKPSDNTLLFSAGSYSANFLTTPIGNGSKASWGINSTTPVKRGTCDTGSNKCNPIMKHSFTFTIYGNDQLVLTNSLFGGGMTCSDFPKTHQTDCAILKPALTAAAGKKRDEDISAAQNVGAIPAQLCQGTCIVLQLDGTPATSAEGKTFTFTATGPDLPPEPFGFTIDSSISGQLGTGIMTFSALDPDPPAGDRTFIITDFPPGGSQGDFQLDQVNCSGGGTCQLITDGSGNNKTKIGFKVTNLPANALLNVDLHVH